MQPIQLAGLISFIVASVILGAVFFPIWFAGCVDRKRWEDEAMATTCLVTGREILPFNEGFQGRVTCTYTIDEAERTATRRPRPPSTILRNDGAEASWFYGAFPINSTMPVYYIPPDYEDVRWELEDHRPYCDAGIVIGGIVLFIPCAWSVAYGMALMKRHWTNIRTKLPC